MTDAPSSASPPSPACAVFSLFLWGKPQIRRRNPTRAGAGRRFGAPAAAADRFTGKNGAILDIVAPAGLKLPRLVVVGTGKEGELKRKDVVKLGGIAMGKVPAVAAEATIFAEFASGALKGDQVADLVLGARLRAYTFDRYKTNAKTTIGRKGRGEFRLRQSGGGGKGLGNATGIADGVVIARDLVNEPANVLYPPNSPVAPRA